MKITRSRFFQIEKENLQGMSGPFPFTLFIQEPSSGRHAPFLYAKSPLTPEAQSIMFDFLERGFYLHISLSEKEQFLSFFNLKQSEIPALATPEIEWETLHQQRKIKFADQAKTPFPFVDECQKAFLTQNFNTIINQTKVEIFQFNYKTSFTVSNAINIAEKLLKENDETSAIISICFHLAKKMNYKDEEELSDIVCAAAFRDIGSTQLDKDIFENLASLNEENRHEWEKHPALSVFLLKKGQIQLSERVYRIILEHHERFNGSGFPRKKLAEFIDPLAELLGLIEHLFHFSSGKINGKKMEMSRAINAILKQHHTENLELFFSPGLLNLLSAHFSGQ